MDTEKLLLFVKLAETQSFTRCAQQQHISASKLSRIIQAMEDELGISLFVRNNRHVALSKEGERFLRFAREQLSNWESIQSELQQSRGTLSGSISIYCSVTASYSFLYDMLTRFRSEHPLIQIKLHTGDPADAIEHVVNGLEDLAIAAKPEQLASSLSFKQFDRSPLVFITSHNDEQFEPLLLTDGPAAWSHVPMIVSERGLARERFNGWVSSQNISPTIYSEVTGNEAIVSMVSLGCGIGLVPKIVLDNSPLKNRVRELDIQPDIAPYEVGVCVQSKRLNNPLVNALWQMITT